MGCKRITLLATLFLFCINAPSYGQFTRQQLVTYAKTFEKMPENTFELQAYVPVDQRPATISAGSPASDLEWTVFDSDYLDGETDGYDTFYPVDPSDQFPGSNTVKLVEGTSLIHTSELYDGADGDRFVLGIDENPNPFFHRGQDSVDNDFYVIQHFDFRNGHIQLRGNASDYALLYADEIQDSVATTGWYLFYTADNSIDLIAFIYPCFQLFGNQQEAYLNAFCNSDSTLSLSDANQFRYAQPVATTPSIFNGIAQVGSTGKEVVSGITVDATGNMYLFGLTDSNLDGGPEFKNEYFVSKTSPDGQLLWVAELPVSEASLLFDATTDGEYLYAAGRTFGNLPGFQNQGRWDGVILKIDQETGEIVDTEQFGTSLIDGFGNITLDDDGHLYVSGAGADPATTGLGDPDFILAKYNKETLEQIWWAAEPVLPTSNRSTEAWGGITYIPGEEPGKGKIVVGGWFANNTAGIAGADGFLALFDDLDNSQPTKIKSTVIGSPGFEADWVWGNTVDRQGNIYAVGYTSGDLAGTNAGEGDAFIVKFDENLENPVFRQVGSNKAERFRKIAIDEKGAVYVSGFTYGDLVRDNQDRDYLSADIIVQKYDADLNLLAARQIGTPNEERGFLAMREGSLYLGGMTEGSMVAQNHGSFDGFLFALDPENLEFTQPNVQEPEEENELKAIATTFPEMPRGTAGLLPFVQGFPTFASGGPFNDLDFTILDTDYIDGENSGGDVFMPVDPADQFPGADKVKLIRCVLNTDLDQVYGSADADRIILGTHEINVPFFLSGPDSVDNDYAVILHLNFEAGYIQLKGSAADYDLVYCTLDDGCQTEGWYLFYTAHNNADLIAFIYPCWDIEPSISGNPPNNPNPFCNVDSTLSLTNPNHFRYAQPINTNIAVADGISQVGSNGKEVVGGMTVDQQGNTYLFGLTDGNMDEGTDAENEIFIVKLDANGDQLWVTELATSEGTILKDGITDDQFLYVCGRTLGSIPGFTNAGRWDGIILKLNLTDGQIVASDQWGNAGLDGYGNIELDDDGNLFVSAQGSPPGPPTTDNVYLVAKHKKSDLSNVWRALNPPNATGFIASAEAWGGLTYVPGSTPGDGRLIAGGWYFSATGANAFISVYEDLNASNPTRPYSEIINTQGIRADWVFDNTVDSRGNIYVAGFTTGNIDSAPLGEGDAFVIKYSPQLTNPIYQQFGTDKADLIRKMMIQNDTLYTVGYTYGNYLSNNADPNLLSGDVFVQKLDTNLNLLNGIQFGTPHEDRAYGYIKGNNLWIGGMTEGYMTGENLGSFDGFLTAVKTTDLTFIKPLVVSVNSKISDSEIKLYPNPTSDMLRIDFGKNYTKLKRIEVFNAMGQSVKVITTIDDEIDVSSLSSGLYFVRLELENGIQIKRLVKQ